MPHLGMYYRKLYPYDLRVEYAHIFKIYHYPLTIGKHSHMTILSTLEIARYPLKLGHYNNS